MIRRTSCEVLLCASVYYAAGITAFDGWICRVDVVCVGADLRVRPQHRLRSGEDGRTHRSAPTEIGVTAFDGWICRVDVACVGADLRVRPQNRLRSGEDRRTHRSAPTKGYTYHRYTSSASVVDKARRVTRCRDARSERPLYQKLQHRSFNDNGRPLARY